MLESQSEELDFPKYLKSDLQINYNTKKLIILNKRGINHP